MKFKKFVPVIFTAIFILISVFAARLFIKQAQAAETTTVIFHYQRGDGAYDNWNMYYWNEADNSKNGSVNFTAEDSFGKVAVLTLNESVSNLGFIVRKSTSDNEWAEKDWDADRSVTITGNKAEIWIYSGQGDFKTSAPSGHSPYTEPSDTITVNIHYYRYAEDYTGWDLWLWHKNGDGFNSSFTSRDSYGAVSSYRVSKSVGELGFIVKYSNWADREPGGDRYIDLSKAKNGSLDVWLIECDDKVYYSSGSVDKSQRVLSASFSDFNKLVLKLSKPINVGATSASSFTVKDSSNKSYTVKSIASSDGNSTTKFVTLTLASNIEIGKTYSVSSTEFKSRNAVFGDIYSSSTFVNNYTYTGDDLGAVWSKNSTTFKVWAPVATEVVLNLYKAGDGGSAYKTVNMTRGEKGVWQTTVSGDLNKVYYTYSITNNGVKKETVDIYARTTGVNGKRGMVINLDSTDPAGWESDSNPFSGKKATDASIYELHVRDFTIDSSSGVKNKGKFLGLTEKGTKNASGQSTGLDYIADLGVSHVQILPMYDYSPNSVDETKTTPQFNWGYDPYNYNSPEGSYSTDPYNGEVRINEMKQMVQAFHNEGIAVVMDVVYNHTAESDNSYFSISVPGYYYRLNADGSFSNASGCGNEVASERAMVRKYIIDSVVYYAKEYHIDGFRFDLMGVLDMETMKQLRAELDKIDPSILLYGEGWTGGSSVLSESLRAVKSQTYMMTGVGAFSDDIRDGVRGNISYAAGTGFISGASGLEERIKAAVVGATWHSGVDYSKSGTSTWAGSPTQTINYVSCHDNHTLWDKICSSAGSDSLSNRVKMNKLAASIVYTSQGVPFMLSGEEILRTKPAADGGFDHNSYKSSDATNSVKWNTLNNSTESDVHDYYQGLIAFRNAHSSLRMTSATDIQNNLTFLNTGAANSVGFVINNKPNNEVSDAVCVIYNANKNAIKVTVPYGTWKICIKDGKAGVTAIQTFTGSEVTVDALSCLAMVQGELQPDTSFKLPDVTGKTVNDAVKLLEGTKYKLKVNIEWQTSETVAADKVISMSPKADTVLSQGDTVTIYASLGKKVVKVTVPDLKNKKESAAKEALIKQGLTPVVKYQYNNNLADGVVVSQSIKSGISVEKGSEVIITVNIVQKQDVGGGEKETTQPDNDREDDDEKVTDSNGEEVTKDEEETDKDNEEVTKEDDTKEDEDVTKEDDTDDEKVTDEAGNVTEDKTQPDDGTDSDNDKDNNNNSTKPEGNGGSAENNTTAGNNEGDKDDGKKGGLPGWGIALIIVGVLGIGGGAAFYFIKRKK